jgi:hypothetical protein
MLRMAHFLMRPLRGIAQPGSDEARAGGCTCAATTGDGMPGLKAPTRPVGARPRFGAEKVFCFFYNLACPFHKDSIAVGIEEQSAEDEAALREAAGKPQPLYP